MMLRIIISILFLAAGVMADEPAIRITDWRGGLVTNTSQMKLKSHQSSILLNYDIAGSEEVGFYPKKRNGYLTLLSAADTVKGDAPNTGIFSFRRADGVRRIVGIASQEGDTTGGSVDSTGLGWFLASPALPATPPGSGAMYYLQDVATRRYYNYVYTGVTPHWTYWNDRAYMTNGRQRPLVFHPYNEFGRDGYVRELVPLSPGEPLIVPLDVEGNLNGQYYYMIGHSGGCGSGFGSNEAVNSDFEAWTADVPDDWDALSGATGFLHETTDTVKNGSSAMRLISKGFNPFNGGRTGVRQTIRANRDSTYELSIWVNRTTQNGSALWLRVYDNTTNWNIINSTFNSTSTNGEWVKKTINFRNTGIRDSVEVELSFYWIGFSSTDTIRVDSLILRQLDVYRFAVVTKPVIANKENVLLTHFPWQTIVEGCAFDDAAYDDLTLDIYRTKANPGNIDVKDNFFLISSINLTDALEMDTLTYIDTLADSAIGHGDFVTSIGIDTLPIGRDASGTLTGVRVGAPTYVSNDSLSNGTNIFQTLLLLNETFLKTKYFCTYYDSLIDAESDSGRSLVISKAANENMYHIGLPPLPEGKAHLVRRLYKYYEYFSSIPKDSITRFVDTIITVDWSQRKQPGGIVNGPTDDRSAFLVAIRRIEALINYWGSGVSIDPPYNINQADYGEHVISYRLKIRNAIPHPNPDSVNIDTTNTMPRLLAEIKNSDSVFVDSIVYDSITRAKPYASTQAPFDLNFITSFQDKLWGASGSRIYWSYLDTGSVWGSFRNIIINNNNSEKITGVVPQRGFVKVYMDRSQYAAFPGAQFEYDRRELVQGLGCVAPHSIKVNESGIFYLSHRGVIREQASEFRERGASFGLISEPINNILLNRTQKALSKAYGFIHNEKYWLSFSDIDTTFVYHFNSGGWSIYDYAFTQATLYDTTKANGEVFVPSGDMIFITGDDDQHYKADTTFKDAALLNGSGGTSIVSQWRSGPLGITSRNHSIENFSVWRESNDETAGLNVRFYNSEGDSVEHRYVDELTTKHDIYKSKMAKSNYFQVDIIDSDADSLVLLQFDAWPVDKGSMIKK
jgi:hypothetical protein